MQLSFDVTFRGYYALIQARIHGLLTGRGLTSCTQDVGGLRPDTGPFTGPKRPRGFLAVIVSRTQTLKEGMANFTVQNCVDCATNIVAL